MNFQCTTAAFTLSPAPDGLRHLVLTRPGIRPSMRFTRPIHGARPSGQPPAVQNRSRRFCLSVGSHFCARACNASLSPFACKSGPIHPCIGRSRLLSSRSPTRQPLAGLPLPSASSCCPLREHRYSYRGLPPHQFMPMPGVHKALVRTQTTLRFVCAAQPGRSVKKAAGR